MLIKICGITNAEDAQAAIACGAHMLGFIFVDSSPRRITISQSASIVSDIKGRDCLTVGVFKDLTAEEVEEAQRSTPVAMLQLHGDLQPYVMGPCIRAIEVIGPDSLKRVGKVGRARYVLFDRPKQNAPADWLQTTVTMLSTATMDAPFMFAGGIDENNVSWVVRALRSNPKFMGIDVCSGIERAPGMKDHARLRKLIENAMEAKTDAITR
jgi:phosphoribosylanthranilate isomerase